MKLISELRSAARKTVDNEDGIIGYGVAWMLGVPLSLLVVLYVIFG